MTPIAVCIPSIGKSGLLASLVDACVEESGVEVVEIWDNSTGTVHNSWPEPAETVYAPDMSIYDEWNSFAATYGGTHHLAFLNDDIVMAPGTLQALAGRLSVKYAAISVAPGLHPSSDLAHLRPAAGTFRQGGFCGWAFVVRRGAWPGIDERFKVWCGDDDLVWKLRGQVGVAEGVSVWHEQSTTLMSNPAFMQQGHRDLELWLSMGRP